MVDRLQDVEGTMKGAIMSNCADCGKAGGTGVMCRKCEGRKSMDKTRWFKFSEKVPPKGIPVLGFSCYGCSIITFTLNNRWKGRNADLVTHWMPLPKPPKEEEREE